MCRNKIETANTPHKNAIKKLLKVFIPYGFIVLYRKFRAKNKQDSKDENNFIWAMKKEEQNLFNKYICDSKIYLEFGSGGSTIAALINSDSKIYSIESSKEWLETMRKQNKFIVDNEKSGRLNLIHADIGKTGNWGSPIITGNENIEDKYLNYTEKVFQKFPEIKLANAVLIDGRFRVACCLLVLMNTDESTKIMFHDFWNRSKYHIIKTFIEIIDGADSLMICKRKKNISDDEILKEYEKYKYNYE